MTKLRLFLLVLLTAMVTVTAVNYCVPQPTQPSIIVIPASRYDNSIPLDSIHPSPTRIDWSANGNGPTPHIIPHMQPKTAPDTPTDPHKVFKLSKILLYYFCGDNIAMLMFYTNDQGDIDLMTLSRWDAPDIGAYNKELALLEIAAADPKSPVYVMELNNSCVRT